MFRGRYFVDSYPNYSTQYCKPQSTLGLHRISEEAGGRVTPKVAVKFSSFVKMARKG